MKLKQYLRYKNSNVDFIGEIPETWETYRLKFLLSALESGKRELEEETPFENGAFSLGGEHVNWDGTLKLNNLRLVSEEFYNSMNQGKIKINDILLVKDGATIGKTALVKKKEYDKMAVNEHIFILRPNKKLIPRLLYYLVYSDCGFSQIKLTETGSAQGGVNSEFISKITFSISEDSKEQKQIADFLDKKTIDINSLLERDKHLIELLKEKRTALINHVVTKGFNPKVKFKDSGIDWIGKIPECWEVRRLKNISRLFGRIGFRGYTVSDLVEEGKGALTIGGKHISKDNKLDLTNPEYLSWNKYYESPEIMIKKGNILITQRGTLGKAVLVNEEIGPATINPNIILIRDIQINSKYLYYFLISDFACQEVSLITSQTAVPMISQEQASSFHVVYPVNKIEQTQIIQYLDKATSKIDKTITKIEEKINLMEEYKESLIHHVVTGKIDVREAVA